MPVKTESEALASYWLQQIEAWQSSGQPQQAYCKANKLSYHRNRKINLTLSSVSANDSAPLQP